MNAQVILKRIVEMAGGAAERGYVLAIAGEGLEELPATLDTVAGRYAVVRPSSEIALRHTLWKSGGAPVLALLAPALAKRIPADLVRRAHGRKIHAVEPAEVLSLALGVQVIGTDDPDLQRLAIEHVDRIRDLIGQRTWFAHGEAGAMLVPLPTRPREVGPEPVPVLEVLGAGDEAGA